MKIFPKRDSFKNKVVLITGASAGIGAALAREFAQQGADLVLTARRIDRLEALANELRAMGRRALVVQADVTQDGDMEAAVTQAIGEFQRIDCVVANAGFGVVGKFEKLKIEDYRRQFETNVFGLLRTVYASQNSLKASKGTLVLIGSVAGYISLPGSSPYAMSKFAVHALAHALTGEFKACGVSVVLIAPGFVKSEIRQVNNRGEYRPDVDNSLPNWMVMPTEAAAAQIVRAAALRKSEQVITVIGKLAVFFRRHFPFVITYLASRGLSGRKEPPK